MKVVTAITIFNDAVGTRMSVSYSGINDETGQVEYDNKRADRVVTEAAAKKLAANIVNYAQEFIDAL